MVEKNYGYVVFIVSFVGFFGVNGLCDYCSLKYGVVGFNEFFNMEFGVLKKDGVYIIVICLFYINIGMFDGVKIRYLFL